MRLHTILFIACLWLSSCGQNQDPNETVVVEDGVKISIKACVQANTKILGSSVDPVAFCKCVVPKFYSDLKNDPEKLKLLKDGRWFDLSKEKQELVTKYFQECIVATATTDSTAKLTITPRMAEGMKKKMKHELIGSEIEQTNDINKYCDCVINSLQTDFSIKEIMKDDFNQSEKYKQVMDKCLKATKKN